MTRFLIHGYFGLDNLGDEALLEALVTALRRELPSARLTVVSASPERTSEWLGVECVPRSPMVRIARALRACDVFVLGPGGIFQDATSARSAAYYSGVVRLARLCGKPVYLVGHGLGPLNTALGRWATRAALRAASGITVRDSASTELARSLCPTTEIVEAADLCFLLDPPRCPARAPGGPRQIGVNLRPSPHLPNLAHTAEVLGQVRALLPCRFLLLPFGEGDRRLLGELMRLPGGDDEIVPWPVRPLEVLATMDGLDGLIGMRYHSVVFAALSGLPLAGIAYDPKVASVLGQLGAEPALDLCEPVGALELAAERIVAELARPVGEDRAMRVAELRELARRNLRPLVEAFGGPEAKV